MRPSDIRISVALVTRNRPDSLARCLESLRAQSIQPFEVVISDDSDGTLASQTRSLAETYRCRYVTGHRRGLYANRNHAALACSGTHVRTMDDDHTFPDGHFEKCAESVRSDPRSVWTTGEVGYIEGQYYGTALTAFQLGPAGVGYPVSDPQNNWAIADGSTIYPAEIFHRGLKMEERFGYGSGYLEFGAFLYAHGYRSRCILGAAVTHHAGIETVSRQPNTLTIGSHLFAAICFNRYFKRSFSKIARFVTPLALRVMAQDRALHHQIWALAQLRWKDK